MVFLHEVATERPLLRPVPLIGLGHRQFTFRGIPLTVSLSGRSVRDSLPREAGGDGRCWWGLLPKWVVACFLPSQHAAEAWASKLPRRFEALDSLHTPCPKFYRVVFGDAGGTHLFVNGPHLPRGGEVHADVLLQGVPAPGRVCLIPQHHPQGLQVASADSFSPQSIPCEVSEQWLRKGRSQVPLKPPSCGPFRADT